MEENKKVRNASLCEYAGTIFRSKLEMKSYITLIKEGFSPEYEKKTFHIWEGKKYSIPCYDQHSDRKLKKKVWGINSYKPLDMKYTPDFTFTITDSLGRNMLMIIECKGQQNDVYPYKKKLFLRWLEENNPNSVFFEIHNIKQLNTAIEIIKNINNNEQH